MTSCGTLSLGPLHRRLSPIGLWSSFLLAGDLGITFGSLMELGEERAQ